MIIGEKEILDYILGFSKKKTKKQVKEWINASKENELLYQSLLSFVNETNNLNEFVPIDADQEFEAFLSLNSNIEDTFKEPEENASKVIPLRSWLVAACVLFIMGTVFFGNGDSTITEKTGKEELLLVLSDGSKINLLPYSSITYPKSFKKEDIRLIELDGEADFDVMHDPEKAFVILGNQTRTEVLGTMFRLKTTSAETSLEVFEGKVQLTIEDSNQEPIIIKKGNKGGYVGGKLKEIEEFIPFEFVAEIDSTETEIQYDFFKKKKKKFHKRYGSQSYFRLKDVVSLLEDRFGDQFKKKRFRISKKELVLINPSLSYDLIIEQLEKNYNLELVKGKCEDCVELRSISNK